MKTCHLQPQLLLLSTLAASAAWAARDPFWPIGYAPAPPPAPVSAQPAEPAAPTPTPAAQKPVTDADWAKARKALTVSGFTKSVKPDTQTTRILVMINRRSYTAGDTVTFVNDDIRFQWRIDTVTEKALSLTPLNAVRVTPKPSALSTKP